MTEMYALQSKPEESGVLYTHMHLQIFVFPIGKKDLEIWDFIAF